MHYAYLRVSTDHQDVDNQRHGILEYANSHNLVPLDFVEDTASGKLHWQKRKIGEVLTVATQGDHLIAAEISRLGRSTLQVLEILEYAAEHEISIHIAKNKMVMDGSMQARITATVLGLAAEIEREFISLRTTEALAKRRAAGLPLGRPKGKKQDTVKLDRHHDQITDLLKKGVSLSNIAKIIECSRSTLYDYLDRKGLRKR